MKVFSRLYLHLFQFLVMVFLAVGLLAYPALAKAPEDSALFARTVHTLPDPESASISPPGTLRLRVDRYGNACLIGSSRLPGCGFLHASDISSVISALQEASRLSAWIQKPSQESLSRSTGQFLTPMPHRPGHPKRFTGIGIKAYVPPQRSQGYVMIDLHDAQIGGGGQYFLKRAETEQLISMLKAIPSAARTLDVRLTRYEKAQAARGHIIQPRRQDDGLGFPFNLIPLLGLFL